MIEPDLETITNQIFHVLKHDLLSVGEDFTCDSDLFSAGLDSMGIAQLLLEIQSRTGIWLEESALTAENLRSCRALAVCICAQRTRSRGDESPAL